MWYFLISFSYKYKYMVLASRCSETFKTNHQVSCSGFLESSHCNLSSIFDKENSTFRHLKHVKDELFSFVWVCERMLETEEKKICQYITFSTARNMYHKMCVPPWCHYSKSLFIKVASDASPYKVWKKKDGLSRITSGQVSVINSTISNDMSPWTSICSFSVGP